MSEEINLIATEFLNRLANSNTIADPELNKESRLLDLEWALRAVMDSLERMKS